MIRPHHVYVGCIGQGVFRSTDSGDTFGRACDGMAFVECHVRALTAHPMRPQTLFVGSEQGLHRSDDGAGSWTKLSLPLAGIQVWSLWQSAAQPELMLTGTCPPRLFRSQDGGQSWTEPEYRMERDCARIQFNRVTTLAGDPTDPAALWAGVEIDGVHRSRDGGRTWQPVGTGLTSRDIHGLVVIPARAGRPRRLVATTNRDLNVSDDDGDSWRPGHIDRVLPWAYCRALTQKVGRPDVLFLGNGDGPPGCAGALARSHDGGDSWERLTLPCPANSTVWNFAVHPADPETIYASTVSGQVFRTFNGGDSWEKLGREFGEIRALAWTPA
jgi:photosystem II stability/assembly factor-like uncharacterized protein